MKASEQLVQTANGFDISTHSFLSFFARAVSARIERDTGIVLKLTGKVSTGKGKMSAVMLGQILSDNPEFKDKIAQSMTALRNPTTILDAMKQV